MEPGRAGGASPARVSRLARAEPKILVPVIRHRSGAVRVAGARPRPLPRARAVGIKGREAGMHPPWNPDALEARARRRLRPRTTRDWARVSRMARAEPKVLVPVIRHRPGVVRVARARPRPPPRSRTVDTKGRGAVIVPHGARKCWRRRPGGVYGRTRDWARVSRLAGAEPKDPGNRDSSPARRGSGDEGSSPSTAAGARSGQRPARAVAGALGWHSGGVGP